MRSSQPPVRRYTLGFEPTAEAHVAQDLARLSTGLESELGDVLRSLLLVGPFARGEGRVASDGRELVAELPGYEVLVVLRRAPERFERVLTTISATWSRVLGSRVALRAVLEATLARPPRTRTYFHAGSGQVLELLPDAARPVVPMGFSATELPETEADQALLEALCALALARLEAPDDARRLLDRTRRAVLACGDAALILHGLYAPTLRDRAEALPRASAGSALCEAYRVVPALALDLPHDAPARRALAQGLLRTLTAAVLELQASRGQGARDLGAYLSRRRDEPAAPAPPQGMWSAARRVASAVGLLEPPHASLSLRRQALMRASVAIALGDAAPEQRRFAARELAAALEHDGAGAPEPAVLAATFRKLASGVLAPTLEQPFADWALVPELR